MSHTAEMSWPEANQRYLMEAIAEVRLELEYSLESKSSLETKPGDRSQKGAKNSTSRTDDLPKLPQLQPPSAIDSLCAIFQLSSFERKLLLLCAGVEMD